MTSGQQNQPAANFATNASENRKPGIARPDFLKNQVRGIAREIQGVDRINVVRTLLFGEPVEAKEAHNARPQMLRDYDLPDILANMKIKFVWPPARLTCLALI